MTLAITKPVIGGSEDTWGATINTALDNIVSAVNNIDLFPSGGIVMWSGSTSSVPSGWYLCDGTNGTPNLVDRFIVGSKTDSGGTHDIGDTGGANSLTLSTSNIPSHTHSFSATTSSAGSHNHTGTTSTDGSHYHANGVVYDVSSEAYYGTVGSDARSRSNQSANETKSGMPRTSTEGNHSHTFSTSTSSNHDHSVSGTTGSTGSSSAFDNRPAYYALAFIMKA